MKKIRVAFYFVVWLYGLSIPALIAQSSGHSSVLVTINFHDKAPHWKLKENVDIAQNNLFITSGKKTGSVISDDLSIPLSGVTPFLSLSVAYTSQDADENTVGIFVRSKNQAGEYSDWIYVHDDSHSEDSDVPPLSGHNKIIRALLFLPKTTVALQYKCEMRRTIAHENPRITALYFSFFSPGDMPEDYTQQNVASKKNPPLQGSITAISRPPFLTRTEWGCPTGQTAGSAQGDLTSTVVTHLIVHHSYSPGNTVTNWPAAVRSVWKYHTDPSPTGNGWSDVGYNWLIDPNGVIYQGRAWVNDNENTRGAHFCGTNAGTMGVCMLGNYSEIPAPEKAVQSLAQLLAYKASDRSIDPLGTSFFASGNKILFNISGHRDGVCATECPGNLLYPTLPEIRKRTAEVIRAEQTSNSELTMYFTDQRGESELRYTLPEKGLVRLYCYDLVGRLLIAQEAVIRSAGQYVVALRSYNFPKAPVIWSLEYRQEGHSLRRLTKILPFIE